MQIINIIYSLHTWSLKQRSLILFWNQILQHESKHNFSSNYVMYNIFMI